MQELLAWLSQGSWSVQPTLDGRIHRFDKDGGKKNGWFWGVQIFSTQTGEPFLLAAVGDWRTGERSDFRTNRPVNRADEAVIKQKIKEGLDRAEKEKARVHGETATEAEGTWTSLKPGVTEYVGRKGLQESFGARAGCDTLPFLAVPVRDVTGKLWGIQRIFNDGAKYFMAGQRVVGCFHSIGPDARTADAVLICEGWATGASLYLATGYAVVCAFNAGNLKPVAEVIRRANPNAAITICGDDDRWLPEGKGNPGREKAEGAASACMGKAIYPVFADATGNPTDFNDLHAREGLPVVAQQVGAVKQERNFIIALGHADNRYFYTSSSNQGIAAITQHNQADLLNLMPLEYWRSRYPSAGANSATGVNWSEAMDDLMGRCRTVGYFTGENVRGSGVWNDEGRTVVHLGDRLWVNGTEVGLRQIASKHIYALGPSVPGVHPNPLTLEELEPVRTFLAELRIDSNVHRVFLGGWLVCARLSGILDWRPQLCVTGEAGSGKTTVLNKYLRPMMGTCKFQFAGGTTAAGMRQTLKRNAVPVLYDEFESDTAEEVAEVKRCIQFIRQASSDSAMVVKGTTNGEPIQYRARFCACVGAIRSPLTNQADHDRFAVVELKKGEKDSAQFAKVKAAYNHFTAEYAERFFARLITKLPLFKDMAKLFDDELSGRGSQRMADQYAPLLAGYALLAHDEMLTQDQVRLYCELMEQDPSGESDQEMCRDHLLSSLIKIELHSGIKDLPVASVIEKGLAIDERNMALDALMKYGLKLDVEKEMLFVQSKNSELSKIFRNTPWHTNWNHSLRRLPNAKQKDRQRFYGNPVPISGMSFPLKAL